MIVSTYRIAYHVSDRESITKLSQNISITLRIDSTQSVIQTENSFYLLHGS